MIKIKSNIQIIEEGKKLLLTPGIYDLEEPIVVNRPDTIVLGMGLATLRAAKGNVCLETGDVQGLILAGLLFDAGEIKSDNLLVIGNEGQKSEDNGKNIYLSDLFFHVGSFAERNFPSGSLVEIFQIEPSARGRFSGENLPVLHASESRVSRVWVRSC